MSTNPEFKTQEKLISRQAAAEKLNVSVRTIDRYLKKQKLFSSLLNGRIWLHQDQISQILASKLPLNKFLSNIPTPPPKVDRVDTRAHSVVSTSRNESGNDWQKSVDRNLPPITSPETQTTHSIIESAKPYKELYIEVRQKYEQQKKRIEAAHYRVGELEARLANSVPALKHQNQTWALQQENQSLINELQSKSNLLASFKSKLKIQKHLNHVYLTTITIFIIFQLAIITFAAYSN